MALPYLSGLLRMDSQRNMVEIGRQTGVSEQLMQHFMSNSPWPGRAVIEGIQEELKLRSELSEGRCCSWMRVPTIKRAITAWA